MNNGKHLRITLIGAIVALVAAVPVAQATDDSGIDYSSVCNQATHTSAGGDLVAKGGGDSGPAARVTTGLSAKPGVGKGLSNAAEHSRALQACGSGLNTTPPPPVYESNN